MMRSFAGESIALFLSLALVGCAMPMSGEITGDDGDDPCGDGSCEGGADGGSAGDAHSGSESDAHGGVDSGADDGGTWRPFSDDSPWNTPIPAAPALAPDSAALIDDFRTSSPYGPDLGINLPQWSIPLYWADGATPVFQVLANVGGEGWLGMSVTASMPIPDGATPDPESDHHIAVIDRQQQLEWGCWNMSFGGGSWSAGVCATSDLGGTGVRVPATEAQPWYLAHGARACGFPLVAGLIRTEEIEAGHIDHALVIAYPHIRSGWFTPPASTAQAGNGAGAIPTRGIPCGGRIQFDPSVDLDSLGLSSSGKIIMRALQEYGAYVGDYSGSISLYAENSADAQAYWGGVLTSGELRGKIDLSSFRVIELGQLYDNGNG